MSEGGKAHFWKECALRVAGGDRKGTPALESAEAMKGRGQEEGTLELPQKKNQGWGAWVAQLIESDFGFTSGHGLGVMESSP